MSNHTVQALRFFALSEAQLLNYLPEDSESRRYVGGDGSDIDFSAEAGMRAAFFLMDIPADEGELKEVLDDLTCVIYLMLGVSALDDYMWFLRKDRFRTRGPYDRGWAVVKRLATRALIEARLEVTPPQITFEELIAAADIVVVDKGVSS